MHQLRLHPPDRVVVGQVGELLRSIRHDLLGHKLLHFPFNVKVFAL